MAFRPRISVKSSRWQLMLPLFFGRFTGPAREVVEKKTPGGAVHESSALLVYIVYGYTCNTLVRRKRAVSQNCNDFCWLMEENMSFCEKTCVSIVSWCLLENCAVLAPICTVSVLVDFLQALKLCLLGITTIVKLFSLSSKKQNMLIRGQKRRHTLVKTRSEKNWSWPMPE